VFVAIAPSDVAALGAALRQHGVKATLRPRTRLVTHLDVDAHGVDRAIAAFRAFYRRAA
jgi:threonine aldolase